VSNTVYLRKIIGTGSGILCLFRLNHSLPYIFFLPSVDDSWGSTASGRGHAASAGARRWWSWHGPRSWSRRGRSRHFAARPFWPGPRRRRYGF
jgi:hypothetical protein